MMNPSNEERRVTRLDKLSRLLDTAFRIPGTDFRIGLDGILGLIPGVGDTLGAVLSSYIIVEAARLGLPKRILIRMIGNVAIESIAGAVPILGDIFDIAWKANIKNFALLRTHLAARSPKERSSRQITRLIVGAMISVVIALATISILVAAFFIRLLTG